MGPIGLLSGGSRDPLAQLGNPTLLVFRASVKFGQTFSVTLVGDDLSTVLSYTVQTDGGLDGNPESAASVAAALAKRINALAPADYTATSDGTTLVVANRAGHRFTLANLFVVDTDQGAFKGTASVALLTLQGAPVVGATWAVMIDYDGQQRTVSHTIGEGETRQDIAKALALGVSIGLGSDFTALADGSELIVVRRSAGGFQANFDDEAAPFGDTAATSSIVISRNRSVDRSR